MPRMLDIVPARRELDFLEISEGFRVIHCYALPGFPELIASLQLFDADGSAIIIHGNPDQGITGEPKSGVSGGPRVACGVITKQ